MRYWITISVATAWSGIGIFGLDLFAGFALSVLNAAVDTNALADTLGENGFGSGIKELILE